MKLQEGVGEVTVLEAAGNIYCTALMASTVTTCLQLHRSNTEINSDSEEMHLTSIFKVKCSYCELNLLEFLTSVNSTQQQLEESTGSSKCCPDSKIC